MLLIGGDLLGVGGGGSNIRLVTFTLGATAVTVLLEQGRFYFDRTLSLLFGGWCIAAALTAINSYDLTASLGYTAWIAFDFLLVIGVSYNVALRIDSESLMDMWILVFRIHVVLLGIELVVRHVLGLSSGASRPHLWFYEPSYVAIFLGGYLTSALYLSGCGERRWGDVALGAIGLLFLGSATAIFAMAVAIAIAIIATPMRLEIFAVSAATVSALISAGFLWFSQSQYFYMMIGFAAKLFSIKGLTFITGIGELLLLRGGNRVVRALIGIDAFIKHPLLGIGIGADKKYISMQPFTPEIMHYLRMPTVRDFNPAGVPFTNIFIDVLGSMGIIGFIPFLGILGYAVFSIVKTKDVQVRAILLAFAAMIILLQMDGNFLRYYLWMPLGLGLGVIARSRRTSLPSRMAGEVPYAVLQKNRT